MSEIGITAINEKVRAESAFVAALRGELEKVIVGQRYMLDRLLIGLLANAGKLVDVEVMADDPHYSVARI